MRNDVGSVGISMGCALAMIILSRTLSWSANHSILWAVLQGLLSWLSVISFVLAKQWAAPSAETTPPIF